jgi:hypothetical protein
MAQAPSYDYVSLEDNSKYEYVLPTLPPYLNRYFDKPVESTILWLTNPFSSWTKTQEHLQVVLTPTHQMRKSL